MMIHAYVAEKERELELERVARVLDAKRELIGGTARTSKPMIGPVVRAAGRTLRRAGAGIEGWASPSTPEAEQRLHTGRRTG